MLSQAQRTAILELNAKKVSQREIARVLKLSRLTVCKVVRENSTAVPEIRRAEKAEPYRQQILDLMASCKGNLVRVHEELTAVEVAPLVDGAGDGGRSDLVEHHALDGHGRRQHLGEMPRDRLAFAEW